MSSLRDYTKIPFEILIVSLTVLPFFALGYFYPALPAKIPAFVKLNGEVSVWAEKGLLAVFRVPLMAVVTQIVCFLMKFGTLQDVPRTPLEARYFETNARLWDCFRWTVAVKLAAASVDTIALSLEQFRFLARPSFIVTGVAAGIGVIGALVYGYRLLVLRRGLKERVNEQIDSSKVHAGVFYFNSADPAMFSNRYLFNFANKWVWVFLACIAAYPLLVFLPESVR